MTANEWQNPLVITIVDFLTSIGLKVSAGTLHEPTFLPGIQINQGALIVDEAELLYPGDLLHEAGHLAVVSPTQRAEMHLNAGGDPAAEMMAIAWSYAALVHLKLDPAVVFHGHGYQGGGASLIENFTEGRYFAVPMLQWVGMTVDSTRAQASGQQPYPHMIAWLRMTEPPA